MKKKDVKKLDHGLYKIFWKDGGYSLASVGSLACGKRWMAPTNWISVPTSKRKHWKMVKSVELIATRN